jgi:hypothetical protein
MEARANITLDHEALMRVVGAVSVHSALPVPGHDESSRGHEAKSTTRTTWYTPLSQ